jgi:predicted kinase
MFAAARQALAAGRSVVMDAVFLDPAMRAGAEAAAGDAPFTGFWLEAPIEVLRARVAGRVGDASDATVEVLERTARTNPGPLGWIRLDASGDSRPAAIRILALNNDPCA